MARSLPIVLSINNINLLYIYITYLTKGSKPGLSAFYESLGSSRWISLDSLDSAKCPETLDLAGLGSIFTLLRAVRITGQNEAARSGLCAPLAAQVERSGSEVGADMGTRWERGVAGHRDSRTKRARCCR